MVASQKINKLAAHTYLLKILKLIYIPQYASSRPYLYVSIKSRFALNRKILNNDKGTHLPHS